MTVSKKSLFFLLKIVIAVVVLIWVVQKVQYATIMKTLQNPESPRYIVFAILLLIPNLGLQWYRWFFLLRLIKSDIRIGESLMSLMGGLTVGLVTPGRIGEFGRALFISGINSIKAIGLIFIDKFYASVIVIIFGLWGVISYLGFKLGNDLFLLAPLTGLAILATGIGIYLLLMPKHLHTFFYNISLLLPFRDKMRQFIEGIDHFKSGKAKWFLLLSVLLYSTYIMQFSLLALSFESISIHALITSTTSTMFTKIVLPVSLGDLGIREGAAIYFFKSFGVQKATAFNSAFLLFLINVMIPAIIGLFFIPRLGWRENGHSSSES